MKQKYLFVYLKLNHDVHSQKLDLIKLICIKFVLLTGNLFEGLELCSCKFANTSLIYNCTQCKAKIGYISVTNLSFLHHTLSTFRD